jgi:hypothetical protein
VVEGSLRRAPNAVAHSIVYPPHTKVRRDRGPLLSISNTKAHNLSLVSMMAEASPEPKRCAIIGSTYTGLPLFCRTNRFGHILVKPDFNDIEDQVNGLAQHVRSFSSYRATAFPCALSSCISHRVTLIRACAPSSLYKE